MILKTIISLAAVFSLIWAAKIKKSSITLISLGLVIGVTLTLISNNLLTAGFIIYMVFCVLMVFYGLLLIKRKLIIRLLIVLPPVLMFLFWLWRLNHWHGNTLLLPIVVLCIMFIILTGRFKMKNETGLLVLISADAFTAILEQLMKNYL